MEKTAWLCNERHQGNITFEKANRLLGLGRREEGEAVQTEIELFGPLDACPIRSHKFDSEKDYYQAFLSPVPIEDCSNVIPGPRKRRHVCERIA